MSNLAPDARSFMESGPSAAPQAILKSADQLLTSVIAEATKVFSTPPRDWTFFTRRCAMQSLATNAHRAEVYFVGWMSKGVEIREIVKIIDSLKRLKTSATEATRGDSRVWGRSFIKNDTARLKDLFADGCVIEPEGQISANRTVRADKFALMPRVESDSNNGHELLTPNQVAEILNVDRTTVLRHFRDYRGVIDVSTNRSTKRGKRRYRTLRIPRYVLERFLHEHRIK